MYEVHVIFFSCATLQPWWRVAHIHATYAPNIVPHSLQIFPQVTLNLMPISSLIILCRFETFTGKVTILFKFNAIYKEFFDKKKIKTLPSKSNLQGFFHTTNTQRHRGNTFVLNFRHFRFSL